MTTVPFTPELWVDNQIKQIDECLSHPDDEITANINAADMLRSYRRTLLRLRQAERFCIAARSLAYYKQPLNAVITALDAWERIATEE